MENKKVVLYSDKRNSIIMLEMKPQDKQNRFQTVV